MEDEVSEAKAFGRKKGTPAPALIATEAISSQSVDTIKSVTKEHWRPCSIDQLIKGLPHKGLIFLPGRPFDPPRARIIPKQENSFDIKSKFHMTPNLSQITLPV